MIISSLINYLIALIINKRRKKIYLIICIIINVLLLGVFKYSGFFIENINNILNINIPNPNLALPIGISFFTFQAMSYTIDVYKKEVPVQYNFFDLLTYISMFPQLIAGPIVRYETIAKELKERTVTKEGFADGFTRFLNGLLKKVLIANSIGLLWNTISSMPYSQLSSLTAWLGVIAYTFQIYFDFSGYSDMAIGLGKMLGFNYLENFNYPYVAQSITDFWRRWHISLSTWFRDYIYIPLGGNRCSKLKNIRNIFVVWMLTGFWHGANWNFIIWGLYYAIILLIEKYILKNHLQKLPRIFRHIYALFFIIIGWTIFAIEDINQLSDYLKIMFSISSYKFVDSWLLFYISNYGILFIIAVIFSIPIKINKTNIIIKMVKPIIYITLFIVTISYIISDTYNPFLYFRF
jgi:alginate O-acetyltransferase complex protein AlgI